MTNKLFRIAALAVASVLVVATSAAAQLAPSKPTDLIKLIAYADSELTCPEGFGDPFQQLALNGTHAPFVIPPGKVLVITAINFDVLEGGSPSTIVFGSIFAKKAGEILNFPVASGTALIAADGRGSASTLIPTGVTVPAGWTVCFAPSGVGLTGAWLYGFIAADK